MVVVAVLVSNSCSNSYGRLTYIFNNAAHCNVKTNHRVLKCGGTNIRMLHDKHGHISNRQSGTYLERQFHQALKKAFNPKRKVQCQSIIVSFSDDEFDTSNLNEQASQALQLVLGYVHKYFSDAQSVSCVQCDGQGGRLHVHLLINAVKENGKTIPTNRFSVFKMRRDFNDYLQDNFEHVTSRTWSNPFSNHLVRKDLSDLPTRSKWEEQLKSIINTVKQEVTNAKTFLSKLSEFGITVSERKQGKSWTYHQTLTTKNGDTKEMKARDFYQRKDKKTGEILTTRGLGSSYTKQSLEVFWQKQLLKQEEFESQSPLTSHKQSKKEVNKDDSTDVQSEQLEKFKSLARDVQARANQQQVRRQLNLQHLCAETKEYKQRVKRQNRQAISRRSDQKRFSNISKQRRANEVATRKLKELQRRKSNNHVKNEGPDL